MSIEDNVLNRSTIDASQTHAPASVGGVHFHLGEGAPSVSQSERRIHVEELVHCKVCGLLLELPEWRCPECESYVCEPHHLPDEFMCLRCHRQQQAPVPAADVASPVPVAPPAPELRPWERVGTRVGEETVGSDGGSYVWVPAGEFMMGPNDSDDEKPVHKVRITKGIWLGKHTVTNARYFDFCAATGRVFPSDSDQGDDHPVVRVTTDDVYDYCNHYGLDSPTEAEWEYSARGTDHRVYPWGSDWDPTRCCHSGNVGPACRTYAVGRFPGGASWCGAMDLAGSVWEWCKDVYDARYYEESVASDPQGPDEGGGGVVVRGGAWSSDEWYCSSAARNWREWAPGDDETGFRCVVRPSTSP